MDIEDRYVEIAVPLHGTPRSFPSDAAVQAASQTPQARETIGVKVRYVMEGQGPAVLLVHGLGASLAVWGENIPSLAKEHTVYALDMPGNGKSDKPRELSYDAVSGAHFLVRFMDALGINSATLIGNSAGGLVTAICGLVHPQRVDGLVLVGGAGLGRQLAWFLRFASVPLLGELLHTPKVRNPRNLVKSVFYEPRSVSDSLLQEILQARNIPQAKRATLKSIRSGSGLWGVHKKMLVLDRLKDFMKPLLIVWGGEDRIIPVSHAHQAARVLSNSTVHIIPRCGHWPQLERSEEFNPLVLRFLKGGLDRENQTT